MLQIHRKKIKDILVEIFIDGNEYVKTSFSKQYIESIVHQAFPGANWQKDIYSLFLKGRNKLYKSFNGYSGYAKFINVEPLDERNECLQKYKKLMEELCKNEELPIFYDRDVSEYRVIYDLTTFESIFGDLLISTTKTMKKQMTIMAKTGAKLPSGKDSRDVLRNAVNPLKEIEYRES